MGIRFEEPWFLLLLLPLIVFVVLTLRSPSRRGKFRKAASLSLRIVIVLCLIGSISGFQWVTTLKERAIYYVVDRSDSMPEANTYREWLDKSADSKQGSDRIGIIATGLDSAVERTLSTESLKGFTFSSQVNTAFSNPASGLQLASGLLPEGTDSRLVLLTDGEENVGDLMRQGRLLKDRGIILDILPLPRTLGLDVSIESMKLPTALYQAEKYTVEIKLNSTTAAEGQLRLYEDNQQVAETTVQVEKGENRFALQGLAKNTGLHRYRAEIYFPNDGQTANNTSYAFARVSGPPKVLVVEGTPNTSANLVSVLQSGLIDHEVIQPELLSRELADYAAYDSLILNNVSAVRLPGTVMQTIEQAVRDYGMGLMMTGGEDSFGMGGYFKTPIEKALPVKMELEGKREIPPLALILVIDRSGSMSGQKLELAKESALRTVELLREKDTVGVLAFDDSRWWVVEPTKLTDKEQVMQQIQSIQSSGGTDIYPATAEAYRAMKEIKATRKHIILLTDGQSAGGGSYEQLTSDMGKDRITMSTVAVGVDADQQLLQRLAELAKGRYYFTDDQSTLPAIFSRETVLLSRTYIVDKPFIPQLGQAGDWESMFRAGVPAVNAYVATTAKETAEVSLLSPEPDPLLARWQYGSGRSVAWTSDVTGKWAPAWTRWEHFSETFSRVLKWTFPQFDSTPYELTAVTNGSRTRLDLKTTGDTDPSAELKVIVTDDDLVEREVQAIPTSPGEYRIELDRAEPGAYLTRIETTDAAGQTQSGASTGFVIAYSPEYRIDTGSSAARLQQLAEMTGGRLLSLERPEEVFAGDTRATSRFRDLSLALIIAALLLWPLDIAARRLALPWHRLAAWCRSWLRWLAGGRQAVPASAGTGADGGAGVERLRQRQRRVAAFYAADAPRPGEARPQGAEAPQQTHLRDAASAKQALAAEQQRVRDAGGQQAPLDAKQQRVLGPDGEQQMLAKDKQPGSPQQAQAREANGAPGPRQPQARSGKPAQAPTAGGLATNSHAHSHPGALPITPAQEQSTSKKQNTAKEATDETLSRLLAAKNRKR